MVALLTFNLDATAADDSLYLYAKDGGKVIDHTDAKPMMEDKGPKVVEFYSPHCGGCINFKPKYIEMAKEIDEVSGGKVKVHAVSCVAHQKICENYGTNGYPSLFTFTGNDEKGTYVKRSMNPTSKYGYAVKELIAAATKGASSGGGGAAAEKGKSELSTSASTIKDMNANTKPRTVELPSDVKGSAKTKTDPLTTARKTAEVPAAAAAAAKKKDDDESDTKKEHPSAPAKAEGGASEDFKQSLKADSKGAGAKKAAKQPKDMDKMKEAIMKKRKEVIKKKEKKGILQRLNPLNAGAKNNKKKSVKGSKATPTVATKGDGKTPPVQKAGGGVAATPGGDKKPEAKLQAKPKDDKKKAKVNPADIPAQPGNTKKMLANTPGTQEYAEKRQAIVEKVQDAKQKQKGGGILRGKPKPAPITKEEEKKIFKKENLAKVEPKKQGFVQRQVEKLPVIRQIVKLTPQEELISDAALSFIESMKNDLFVGSKSGPMDTGKVQALKSWLQLLSVSLPPEWGLHRAIDDLDHNINTVAESQESLNKLLAKHIPSRKTWSQSCGDSGFSCGLWKLIHIMSVGLAEHRGGLNLIEGEVVDVETRVFSPMEAADTLREYIDNFFSCNECRNHFIGMYDECKFRRCDRLSDEAGGIEAEDWKQFALWLWEVHNDVSVRVTTDKLKEKKKKAAEEEIQREAFITSLYPSIEQCIGCVDEEGSWIEPSVFAYLERAYWAEPDAKMDKILYGAPRESPAYYGILKMMLFFAACLVICLQKRLSSSSGIRQTLIAAKAVRAKLEDKIVGKKRKA